MKKMLCTVLFFAMSLYMVDLTSNAEYNFLNDTDRQERAERMYQQFIIDRIEEESDIRIPDYVEFKYIDYMYNLATQLDLSKRLVFRLVYKESCFVDTIVSPEGAYGFFQLMPKTEHMYEVKLNTDSLGLYDNYKNIYIGMNLLKDLYVYWNDKGVNNNSSTKLMLACYNAGIVAVLEYKGIPPYKETINYIDFILKERSRTNNFLTQKPNDNSIKDRT